MLFDVNDKIRTVPGAQALEARDLMIKTGFDYLNSLAGEAQGDAELQRELAGDQTRIPHIKDGGPFLGFHGSRGRGSAGKIIVRIRIPAEAGKRAKAQRDIMLKAQTAMSVNAKRLALNSVIRGWCQYYQYATVPVFMFKKLE